MCMFILQSRFDNPPHRYKVGLPKTIQLDFQISKVGSLDFLDLKVIGSPASTVISGFSPCIVITIEGITVKAPNIAHLSILTSVGYNKKETKLKKNSQLNKAIIK